MLRAFKRCKHSPWSILFRCFCSQIYCFSACCCSVLLRAAALLIIKSRFRSETIILSSCRRPLTATSAGRSRTACMETTPRCRLRASCLIAPSRSMCRRKEVSKTDDLHYLWYRMFIVPYGSFTDSFLCSFFIIFLLLIAARIFFISYQHTHREIGGFPFVSVLFLT